ncbi:MAG: hypothetical protein HZR80_20300 [Candidatus Heimdallarchaeota archaeon]
MIDATDARTALIDSKIRRSQKIVRLIIWLTVPVMFLTLVLAWVFYAESYEFIYEMISALGNIYSFDLNNDNTVSMLIMTIGFSISAFMNLVIAIFYFIRPVLKNNILKGFLYIIVSVGAAGIAIPGDHPTLSLYHSIGSIMFIFGFAMVNFVSQLLRFARKHDLKFEKKPLDFYLDMVVVALVFSVMIILGIFYILDKTIGFTGPAFTVPLWQKILLIVDFIAIFVLDLDDM